MPIDINDPNTKKAFWMWFPYVIILLVVVALVWIFV